MSRREMVTSGSLSVFPCSFSSLMSSCASGWLSLKSVPRALFRSGSESLRMGLCPSAAQLSGCSRGPMPRGAMVMPC